LSSAPSIEETGLDAVLYGERGQPFFSPHEGEELDAPFSNGETFHDALAAVNGGVKRAKQLNNNEDGGIIRLERGKSTPLQTANASPRLRKQGSGFGGRMEKKESFAEVWHRLSESKNSEQVPKEEDSTADDAPLLPESEEKALPTLRGLSGTFRSGSVKRTSSLHLKLERLSGIEEGDLAEESAPSSPRIRDDENPLAGSGTLPSPGGSMRLQRSSSGARNRWRRLKHTVQFASHMTQLRYTQTSSM